MDRETVIQKLNEAQDHFTQGRDHIKQGRKLLFEIEQAEGFTALGYKSMRALIQGECKVKKSQAYREIAAAKIEQTITGEVGNIPERWVRELGDLKNDPVALKAAHQIAQETARTLGVAPSGTIYRGACETVVEIQKTGSITVDEHQVPVNKLHLLEASTINKASEVLARQSQHIRDRMSEKGKRLFKAEGTLTQVQQAIQSYVKTNGDHQVVIVVYEVKQDDIQNTKSA